MNSFQKISEHLFLYEDTCNVYVIKDGETALLIDGGSGAVLDQLGQIGCHQVEWVLLPTIIETSVGETLN